MARRDRLLPMTTSPVTFPGGKPSTSDTLSITAVENDAVDASGCVTPDSTCRVTTKQKEEGEVMRDEMRERRRGRIKENRGEKM